MVRLSNGAEFGPATIDVLAQWTREGRVPPDAVIVDTLNGQGRSALEMPDLARILGAPPTNPVPPLPQLTDSAWSGIVPYRNLPALVGYYLAVFSVVPVLGLVLGPTALLLGILGFVKGLKNPRAKGKVHAWVAIILGLITTAFNCIIIFMMFTANL